jgi:type I restriction enzyme S subunit
MIRLREITKVTAGQAAPKEFSEKGCPFIRAGHLEGLLAGLDLNDLPKVSEEVALRKRLKKIPKGTILFAKSGMSATKNRVYITEKESYFVSHLAGILPSERISNSYLARYLSWYNPSKLILDPAYPSIRLEDINNLLIPLPPLEEQKKIAAILDAADDYRQKTKALIDKYDQLTQSLFLDMFGDPVSNPMGWEIASGKEFYEVRGRVGWKGYKKTDLRLSGAIVLGATHITKCGTIDLSKVVYLSDEKFLESPEIMIQNNDLIFVQRGNTIGKIGLIREDLGRATINPVVLILRPKAAHPLFLLHLILNKSLNRQLVNSNSGSAQPMITQKSMNEIQLIQVPLTIQNQFAERVAQIEKQKQQAVASLVKAEELFSSLLQRAFKGELTS